jgi:transcriptional regulator with XRE-family HTH domain
MNVSALVKELRSDGGLSLRDLASASDLAVSTIHRTERGELRPTVDTLDQIVSATGRRLRLEVSEDSSGSVLGLGLVLRRELDENEGLSVVRRAAELTSRFDSAPAASRARMLVAEPPPVGVAEWDSFLGGFAEWLAVRSRGAAPAWTESPTRFLDHGWWVTPMVSVRAWEYAGTPIALKRRGVFLHRESLVNR